jgi:ABC-type polysaccharide/polyol phosphate transport system ATPase subunit
VTTNAIECERVSKRFRIPLAQYSTLKGRLVRPFARTAFNEFDALNDVSFHVGHGEFFGIVGRNGSGKSTLLKLIAGIYHADTGTLRIDGDIAPFIELGVGFNDELSGRDNLFLNGALLGLSRTQLQKKYDTIVEFAELEDFMDLKLRNFSSGMQVRLAFSIALQAGADILLTDEVLAVGDERFQRKCFDVFREQRRRGQTVVFVSHDMGAVSQFCDRGLLLERGKVVAHGPIHEVVREYHRLNNQEPERERPEGGARIVDTWFEDAVGEVVSQANSGDALTVAVRFEAGDELVEPIVGISVRDRFGYKLLGMNSALAGTKLGTIEQGGERVVRFRFNNQFATGHYKVSASVAWPTSGDMLDLNVDAVGIDVHAEYESGGVMFFEYVVDVAQAKTPSIT